MKQPEKRRLKTIGRSELVAQAGGEENFRYLFKRGIIGRANIGARKGASPAEARWYVCRLTKFNNYKYRTRQRDKIKDFIAAVLSGLREIAPRDPDRAMKYLQLSGHLILREMRIPWAYILPIPGNQGLRRNAREYIDVGRFKDCNQCLKAATGGEKE